MIWGSQIRGGSFRKVHIGDVRTGLDDLFKWISGDRKEIVAVAKARLHDAAVKVIAGTNERAVEYLMDKGIPKKHAAAATHSARRRWPSADGLTRFHLGSGLTEIAQNLGMDQRFELELVASKFAFA